MKRTFSLILACALAMPFGIQALAVATGQIVITKNADFVSFATGTGTAEDPYVIANVTIIATDTPGISISGTTAFFVLDHPTVHVTGSADGILLTHVVNGLISHANVDSPPSQGGGMGIHLLNSSNVVINGDSINSMQSWGMKLDGGTSNTVEFMNLNHNGLTNPASKDTSLAMGASNPFLLGRSGQAPGGLLLINSSGNKVHDDLLNEDAYANLELVNADNNTIGPGLVSRYPDYFGLSLEGSSGNTITDVSLQTADFDGLLVRASNNNTFTSNTFSANGPIGNEWAAGVVPYFIAGAYVGWGSSGNTFTLNKGNFGNTGPDLEFDDANVPTPSASVQGGVLQTNNPLNGAGGSDPGGSVVVGKKNVVCGNSFAPNYWFPSSLNANNPC